MDKDNFKELVSTIAAITISTIVVIGVVLIVKSWPKPFGAASGAAETSCQMSKNVVNVGNQQVITIVGTTTARAWARIEYPNATSTLFLSLGGSTNSVSNFANFEYAIGRTISSTTQEFIEFGRKTNLPFVGPITGLTGSGSTSVIVEECSYQ